MLVHHDDAEREYVPYGPAGGLPDTKVGTFSVSLIDEAKARGWTVISMKNDWKQIFPGNRFAGQSCCLSYGVKCRVGVAVNLKPQGWGRRLS